MNDIFAGLLQGLGSGMGTGWGIQQQRSQQRQQQDILDYLVRLQQQPGPQNIMMPNSGFRQLPLATVQPNNGYTFPYDLTSLFNQYQNPLYGLMMR